MGDGSKKTQGSPGIHLLNIKSPKRTRERLKFSFQRIDAKLTVLKNAQDYQVSIVLADISELGCGLFCTESLDRGALVEIMITEPRLLRIKGAVAWTANVDSKMDSSTMRLPHRCGIQFLYSSEAEKSAVIEFNAKLKENIMNAHSRHVQERVPGAAPENFVGDKAPVAPGADPAITPVAEASPPAEVTPMATPDASGAPVVAEVPAAAPAVNPPTSIDSPSAPAATPAPTELATDASPSAATPIGAPAEAPTAEVGSTAPAVPVDPKKEAA